MRLLLDTHAFLWFVLADSQLSARARSTIVDPANDVLFSPASYWEIAIKISMSKYTLPDDYKDFMERQIAVNDFTILPISVNHAAVVTTLPFHHRDPFDRLLIAQAIAEQVPIISVDVAFDPYPVTRLW